VSGLYFCSLFRSLAFIQRRLSNWFGTRNSIPINCFASYSWGAKLRPRAITQVVKATTCPITTLLESSPLSTHLPALKDCSLLDPLHLKLLLPWMERFSSQVTRLDCLPPIFYIPSLTYSLTITSMHIAFFTAHLFKRLCIFRRRQPVTHRHLYCMLFAPLLQLTPYLVAMTHGSTSALVAPQCVCSFPSFPLVLWPHHDEEPLEELSFGDIQAKFARDTVDEAIESQYGLFDAYQSESFVRRRKSPLNPLELWYSWLHIISSKEGG